MIAEKFNLELYANKTQFYRGIVLGLSLVIIGSAIGYLDVFRDVRVFLKAPAPSWIVLVVGFFIYEQVSQLRDVVIKSHNAKGELEWSAKKNT